MRVLTALVLCSAAVFAGAWTSGATVAPPKCSDAWTSKVDSASTTHHQLLWVSLPAIQTMHPPWPAVMRFCGPATVNLRVGGRSVQVHSGYCDAPGSFWQYKLFVGLAGYVPAAPDKFFGLAVHDPRAVHGGTFTRAYMSLQLAGHSLRSINQRLSPPFPASVPVPGEITRGTVTIAKSLRAGTFVFHLRDATAITGSWACGEKPYNDG